MRGETLGRASRDWGFHDSKNLLHPSQFRENLRQLAYVGFVDFFFYLCFEVKKEHYSCRRKSKASSMVDSRVVWYPEIPEN